MARTLPYDARRGLTPRYIMIKPDGVQRGLIGDIVKRFEQKGARAASSFRRVLGARRAVHASSSG